VPCCAAWSRYAPEPEESPLSAMILTYSVAVQGPVKADVVTLDGGVEEDGRPYVKGAFTDKNIVPSFRYRRLPAFPRGGRTMAGRPRGDPQTDSRPCLPIQQSV